MQRHLRNILLLLIGIIPQFVHARALDESELAAASSLGEDIASWMSKLDAPPKSVAVFSVHANEPLETTLNTFVENEVIKFLAKKNFEKAFACNECRAAQVSVRGDTVIIEKGTLDHDKLKAIGLKIPVESFLIIELYATKLALVGHATLYKNPGGELLGAEKFHIPSLSLSNTSVQVLITYGSGTPLYKRPSTDTGFTSAVNLFLLEEVGFGKAGLNLGTVMSPKGSLLYLDPTLSFRGRFGSYSLGWSLNLGLGYGFAGSARGPVPKISYEVFFGSFCTVGAEFSYLLPTTTITDGLVGYAGAHIGIAFGR